MDNGGSDLAHKFAGLGINGVNNNDSSDALFQVLKAVEAAEATIKQQVLRVFYVFDVLFRYLFCEFGL